MSELEPKFKSSTEEKTPVGEKCVFCDIVAGKASAGIIRKSKRTFAITAREDGYPLVISRKHVENLFDSDLDNSTIRELGVLVRDIARAVKQVDEVAGVTILCNNGHDAGQEISHLHFHVMPRRRGDGKVRVSIGIRLTQEALNHKASMYRGALETP